MAAALLHMRKDTETIAAVIVGADRVAANGDTANKIGTYALAVSAKYHGIKFVVAAPRTTIDMETKTGAAIRIEERPQVEVTNIRGPRILKHDNAPGGQDIVQGSVEEVSIAARGTRAWNPAFDVTPAELIDAIVTEKGVVEKDEDGVFKWVNVFDVALADVPEVEVPKTMNVLPDGTTALGKESSESDGKT